MVTYNPIVSKNKSFNIKHSIESIEKPNLENFFISDDMELIDADKEYIINISRVLVKNIILGFLENFKNDFPVNKLNKNILNEFYTINIDDKINILKDPIYSEFESSKTNVLYGDNNDEHSNSFKIFSVVEISKLIKGDIFNTILIIPENSEFIWDSLIFIEDSIIDSIINTEEIND